MGVCRYQSDGQTDNFQLLVICLPCPVGAAELAIPATDFSLLGCFHFFGSADIRSLRRESRDLLRIRAAIGHYLWLLRKGCRLSRPIEIEDGLRARRKLLAHAVRRATHRLLNSDPHPNLVSEIVPKSDWGRCGARENTSAFMSTNRPR